MSKRRAGIDLFIVLLAVTAATSAGDRKSLPITAGREAGRFGGVFAR